MRLAEKLNNALPPQSGLPCGFLKLLDSLSKEDRAALEAVMDIPNGQPRLSNRQIHKILLEEGKDIAFTSISSHRRKQCRCYTMRKSDLS
jgi:hypothetical protein